MKDENKKGYVPVNIDQAEQIKELLLFLKEDIHYLNHWMSNTDPSQIMYTHMKERKEFTEHLLRKYEKH